MYQVLVWLTLALSAYAELSIPREELNSAAALYMFVMLTMPSMDCMVVQSVEKQASWADPITQNYADQYEFVNEIMRDWTDEELSHWNKTSVANLAYISLHGPDENVKGYALHLLKRFIAWHRRDASILRVIRDMFC